VLRVSMHMVVMQGCLLRIERIFRCRTWAHSFSSLPLLVVKLRQSSPGLPCLLLCLGGKRAAHCCAMTYTELSIVKFEVLDPRIVSDLCKNFQRRLTCRKRLNDLFMCCKLDACVTESCSSLNEIVRKKESDCLVFVIPTIS